MKRLLTLLLLALLAVTAPAQATPMYWIATGDTTGYTIQNVFIDLLAPDQRPAVGRIALNSVVLRDGELVRPRPVQTLLVDLPDSVSVLVMGTTIVNLTLAEALARKIAEHAVADSTVGLPDSVTVRRTEAGVTEELWEYSR